MPKYINADEVIIKIRHNLCKECRKYDGVKCQAYECKYLDCTDIIGIIEDASTADVQEVIHAKWEINSDGYYPYCSHCKNKPENGKMTKWCSECGARMDLKEK